MRTHEEKETKRFFFQISTCVPNISSLFPQFYLPRLSIWAFWLGWVLPSYGVFGRTFLVAVFLLFVSLPIFSLSSHSAPSARFRPSLATSCPHLCFPIRRPVDNTTNPPKTAAKTSLQRYLDCFSRHLVHCFESK